MDLWQEAIRVAPVKGVVVVHCGRVTVCLSVSASSPLLAEDSSTGKETPSPVGSLDYSTQAGKQGKVVKSFSVSQRFMSTINVSYNMQLVYNKFFWPWSIQGQCIFHY